MTRKCSNVEKEIYKDFIDEFPIVKYNNFMNRLLKGSTTKSSYIVIKKVTEYYSPNDESSTIITEYVRELHNIEKPWKKSSVIYKIFVSYETNCIWYLSLDNGVASHYRVVTNEEEFNEVVNYLSQVAK